jgi:hypothetical protein
MTSSSSAHKWIAATVTLATFLIYLTTVARTQVSYGDSSELTTTGYLLSVAHPPGYPVFSLLTFIATHLPISGTIAFRANLLAAGLQSITVGLTYLLSLTLLQITTKRHNYPIHHHSISYFGSMPMS